DSGLLQPAVEDVAELPLRQTVDALHLLLLARRLGVLGALAPASRGLAVLAGRVGAALHGALLREAARALEKQLRALPAAQPADGTRVARHRLHPPLLGRPAPVVRDGRDVADGADLQPGSRQRLDRGLAARPRALHPDVHAPHAQVHRL